MTTAALLLPADIARCVGRFGLGPDDPLCPRRDACVRYQALRQQPPDTSVPLRTPVHTGLCRDGEDWMIGGQA